MRTLVTLTGWLALTGAITGAALAEEKAATPAAVKIELTDADKAAVAELKKSGAQVLELAQNDNRVDVSFHLADAKIGNDHLKPLKGLKFVYSVNVRGKEIDDNGLQLLAETPSLVRLHLEKTKVTDAGLKHLANLQNLEYLNLYGTEITDAGLDALVPLKKLQKVYTWQTKVTIDGVAKLKKARPDLKIIPDLVDDKRKAEEEAKRKIDDDKKKAEEDAKKKAEEEAKKKADEEKKKAEEAAKKKAEEDKKKADEAKKQEDAKKDEKKEEKK